LPYSANDDEPIQNKTSIEIIKEKVNSESAVMTAVNVTSIING